MNKHHRALELHKILELLSKECSCEDARQRAVEITPLSGKFEIEEALKQTDDAFMLIGRFGAPSLSGVKNMQNAFRRAEAGGCLSAHELLGIGELLRITRGVRQWRSHSASVETSLDLLFERLYENKHLEERISSCILSEDEIADNASQTLYDIRRKMRIAASKARETLEKIIRSSTYKNYLQDAIITQRSGRFVVPVKAECRGQVPGLVHDTSSSGATVFIEPMGVVQANNDIRVLESKEAAEIERILFELSAEAGSYADTASESYEALVELSLIFAKASLGYKMKATMPIMNTEGRINLKNARHPLLNPKTAVPTDINLGISFDTLVITGPNTGGKTVSLKTVGLLTLMAMCGLLIPADEKSELSVFSKVLVDIGDEQSIEQSLSTFSAHMTNIVSILGEANRSSLVLIDELGAGTDPVEGAALAVSILERLRMKGAKIASTTHYAELKEFALRTPGVENGCCEFDVASLRPTYKLLIGVPGRSNAFAISKRLGIEDSIVERAQELVSSESRQFEDVVETLDSRRQELDEELKKAREATLKAINEKKKAEEIAKKAEEKAQREIEKARHEASLLLSRTKAQADALINELEDMKKAKNLTAEDKSKLRKSIKEMEEGADPIREKEQEEYTLPRPLKAGDTVLLRDIDKKATVLETPAANANTVFVQAGIIKTRTDIKNIKLLEAEKVTLGGKSLRKTGRPSKIDTRPVTEIDVRGYTAEEALMTVDRAIDTAVLTNVHMMTVIHGKGTGVLRKEIHAFLRHHKAVKSFRLGAFGEGEAGVTVIEFK
ncbi:MAG: endonuclease MutS2 [Eubacteriales bacterium]|nr:endonuclease MutS2 [Eubacteriales bacterium]